MCGRIRVYVIDDVQLRRVCSIFLLLLLPFYHHSHLTTPTKKRFARPRHFPPLSLHPARIFLPHPFVRCYFFLVILTVCNKNTDVYLAPISKTFSGFVNLQKEYNTGPCSAPMCISYKRFVFEKSCFRIDASTRHRSPSFFAR